jgi:hypothetical protein
MILGALQAKGGERRRAASSGHFHPRPGAPIPYIFRTAPLFDARTGSSLLI